MDWKNIDFDKLLNEATTEFKRIVKEVQNFLTVRSWDDACLSCKDSRSFKDFTTIWYTDDSGIAPLCTECFNDLDITDVEIFIREHIAKSNSEYWRQDSELKVQYSRIMDKVREIKNSQK